MTRKISDRIDLPNSVTFTRYLFATILGSATCSPLVENIPYLLTSLLILTYLSDVIDGKIARRSGDRFAPEGRVIDSSADSYTFIVVFICLVQLEATSVLVLLLVVAVRALFDLTRFITLTNNVPYAEPTFFTKLKGLIYGIGTTILYFGSATGNEWITQPSVKLFLNGLLVLGTLAALISFWSHHGKHVKAILQSRSAIR